MGSSTHGYHNGKRPFQDIGESGNDSIRVVGSLERFTNYEALFNTNPAVQKAIGALYSDLIDFCTRVVQFHSRSSLRAMVTTFDKDFRDVSEHINFHSAEIDWAANAASIEESQRARTLEEEVRFGTGAFTVILFPALTFLRVYA